MMVENNIDLTFEVMVNSDKSERDIFKLLLAGLDSTSQTGGYITSSGNVLNLSRNALYGKDIDINDENAWMHYRFSLSVFPEITVDLTNQISLAKKIVSVLHESDCLAELVAEFEI